MFFFEKKNQKTFAPAGVGNGVGKFRISETVFTRQPATLMSLPSNSRLPNRCSATAAAA
jgi:hypothetical protein